ncbi:MAG: cytochrome c, partial [Rhodoferax sp.]|nr:cytochrome c [Rhodoferax sp.]
MKTSPSKLSLGLIATAVLTLTACGGGGGASGTAGGGAPGTTVTGVAATGLAIEGGAVTLQCKTGTTAAATTAADGSFTVDVSSVTLPCVAKVDYADSTGSHRLHSLVKTAGNVNITPITDMVVAGLSTSGVAADVKASDVDGYTDAQILTATQRVQTDLESKGIRTANLPIDVIRTKFEAKHGLTDGDSHDGVLDEIGSKLGGSDQVLSESELDDVENEFKSSHDSSQLGTSTGQAGNASAGKASYDAMCSSCHGAGI